MKKYDFNSFDLEAYLHEKGVEFKTVSGGAEYLMRCVSADHDDTSPSGKMYMRAFGDNKGVFQCKSAECGFKGNTLGLLQTFGDGPEPYLEVGDSFSITRVMNSFVEVSQSALGTANRDYLKSRGFTRETIEQFGFGEVPSAPTKTLMGLGYSEKEIRLAGLSRDDHSFVFSPGSIVIPYFVGRDVLTVRVRNFDVKAPKYQTLAGVKGMLYNSNACQSLDDTIYVCEGEFDAVTLAQHGHAAVATAGAGNWDTEWTTVLQDFSNVYFVFDGEDGAYEYSEKAATVIGAQARAIRLPEGMDVNDFFKENDNYAFKNLIERAVEESFPFKSLDFHFAEWDMYVNSGQQWLKTGYKKIDESLPTGILPNQLIIWIAKPSVGKTQIAINMMYRQIRLYPDKKFLFFSLELKGYEVLDRLIKIHRFYDLTISAKEALDFFRDRIYVFDDNRIQRDQLWKNTEMFLEKYQVTPAAAYLDYLGYYAQGYRGESYEQVSRAVSDLKAYSKEFSIPMFVPHQTTKSYQPGVQLDIDAGADSAKVSAAADYMFTLSWADQAANAIAEEATGQVVLKVVKNRSGPAHAEMNLQRAPFSYTFCTAQDSPNSQAQGLRPYEMALKEHQWSQARYNYEQVVNLHQGKEGTFLNNPHNKIERV